MGSGGKDKEQKMKKRPGRVPTACAECRRLKLRCDQKAPCGKCVSRGCGSICPDGVLMSGKGGRLLLANTEELHDRIEQLSSRNRELESALRKLQETVSDQPHPLLVMSGVLRLNFQQGSSSGASSSSQSTSTSRISPVTRPPEVRPDEDHNAIDAFGTLVIHQKESSFFGKTARPEYLAQAMNKSQRPPRPSLPRLTRGIAEKIFPEHDEELLAEVLDHLPSHADALHLCDFYLEYGKFLYSPMPKKELEDTLALVYRAKQFEGFNHYHSLSLLFVVFAIATLFNPYQQTFSTEAHEFYYLSRTALNFSPPFEETTLTAIQALIHIAQYLELSDFDSGNLESSWTYLGQAMQLAQKIGLHLNSNRWKLVEEVTVQRRHDLFWQLFVSDTWKSLHLGRLPSVSSAHLDCPQPPLALDGESGSFHSWNVHYTLLLHSVIEAAFGPRQPAYIAILDFDRKIRDFDIPLQWRTPSEESTTPPPEVSACRWLVLSSKEIALLNLHRAHFAQALQDMPADLQRHRYLPSVVAVYRSAWRLIRGLAMAWMAMPKFLARVNLAWSHGLSAAIVLSLFVTRAPTSHLATAALEELDNLASLFDSAASSCRPAAKLLNSVESLHRKAHEAIGLPRARSYHHDESSTASSPISVTASELDRLNGKTSLLPEHASSLSTSSIDARSRATSVTISDTAENHSHPTSFHTSESLHPTLAQDLQEFGRRSSAAGPVMSFYDYPSNSQPTPPHFSQGKPGACRETRPATTASIQPFPLSRIDPLPQAQYFPPPHYDQYMDPRRMGFAGSYMPSGFVGGFGASAIALDSSWNSFVEQLGF